MTSFSGRNRASSLREGEPFDGAVVVSFCILDFFWPFAGVVVLELAPVVFLPMSSIAIVTDW